MDTASTSRIASIAERTGSLLTYDFCPWANRWVYWLKKPIASLLGAAVISLGCAVFVKPIAIVGFIGVSLTVALGYFWPAVALRRVRAELSFAETRVREGETCVAVLRVTNRWPWPIFGLALENGFVRAGSATGLESGSRIAVALDSVPGWSSTEFRWEFVPACRGVYPLATPRLTTGFPFGLKHASRPVERSARLTVWPKTFPIDTLLDAETTSWRDDLLSERRVGNSGDLLGTRGFRPGDSLRRVHWAQTARQGRLIVSERQGTTQSSLRIVVDVAPGIHSDEHPDGSLEWSFRIAASLCEAYHAQHAHLVCVVGGDERMIASGQAGLRSFLDFLAAWTPGPEAPRVRATSAKRDAALELQITTDVGLARRPSLHHPRVDQRCIVLRRDAFQPEVVEPASGGQPAARPEGAPLCTSHSWVEIKDRHGVAGQFRRQWRRVCSDG